MTTRPLLSDAMIARMQRTQERTLTMTGELWRIGGGGRRTLLLSDVPLLIVPGGDVSIGDNAIGVTGRNSTFVGYTARDLDVRENDQFRNVRQADGSLWMDRYDRHGNTEADGVRFTIGTVEKWPTVTRLRIHEEGT